MPLIIPVYLYGYAVKAILHGLVHADAGNVRFWHKADSVSCLTYRVPISQKYQFHFPVRQL